MSYRALRLPAYVFWFVSVLLSVLGVLWVARGNRGNCEGVGLVILLLYISPAVVSAACALGFVVAALVGAAAARMHVHFSCRLRLDSKTARWFGAAVLAGCVSSAVIAWQTVAVQHSWLASGPWGWWCVWIVATVFIRCLQFWIERPFGDVPRDEYGKKPGSEED